MSWDVHICQIPPFLRLPDGHGLAGSHRVGARSGKGRGRVLGAGAGGQGGDAEHCNFPSPMEI